MLGIRILLNRYPFAGSRSVGLYSNQCCGSWSRTGSGRIRIILPDPDRDRHLRRADLDPDRYLFQADENIDKVDFFQKISICCPKYLKPMTHLVAIKVKNVWFSNMRKTGNRIRIQVPDRHQNHTGTDPLTTMPFWIYSIFALNVVQYLILCTGLAVSCRPSHVISPKVSNYYCAV